MATALYLFRGWYFAVGYLTFGDLPVPRSGAVLSQAFQLWNVTERLGFPDSTHVLVRAFFGVLYQLHVSEPIAERIVWFYFAPPLLIAGSYLLAKTLTGDRIAAGAVSLAVLLSPDFLMRSIGGHASALIPIALAPWALLATVRVLRDRNLTWLGIIGVVMFVSTAYDSRWTLPTFALIMVVGLALCLPEPRGSWTYFCAFALAAISALVFANLPWLLPLVLTGSGSPAPAASYLDAAWIPKLSYATLLDALAGWNPALRNDFSGSPFIIQHLPRSGILFVAAVWLCALGSRKRITYLLFACYLCVAFLFKGTQPPLGMLYLWLFQHAPLFHLYREPLKFGSTLSLCAALILGLGVSSTRNRARSLLGSVGVCFVVVALSFNVFGNIGGTLQSRETPRSYEGLKALLQRDSGFGRVLWIPQVSRWATASDIHPFGGAADMGNLEWLRFLRDKISNENGLSYTHSPLFFDLLNWNGYRYVIIDQDTEIDATFRSAAFPIEEIRLQLNRDKRFHHIATFGPLSVYEIVTAFAAPIWSVDSAAAAFGMPNALNAGALLHAFPRGAPVILQNDLPNAAIPLRQRYIFDPPIGKKTSLSLKWIGTDRVDRIAGADALDWGPQRGDALIDQTGPPIGTWNVRMAYGSSTLALDPPLGALGAATLRALSPVPRGEILQSQDHPSIALRESGGTLYNGEPFSLPRGLVVHTEFPGLVRAVLNVRVPHGWIYVTVEGTRHRVNSPGGSFSAMLRAGETPLSFEGETAAATIANISTAAYFSSGTENSFSRGALLTVIPTALAEAPSVEVVAAPLSGFFHDVSLVLQLRDPLTGRDFSLVGPTYMNGIAVGGELDVRQWLLRTIGSNRDYGSVSAARAIERLQLTGAGMYGYRDTVVPRRTPPLIALKAKATDAAGYVVRSAVRLPAYGFSCLRCQNVSLLRAGVFRVNFHRRSPAPRSWVGSAVAIDAFTSSETGIVTLESNTLIQGITTLGTPFAVRRTAIRAIRDAPDAVVVELSSRAIRPSGVLYLSVDTLRPDLKFKLLVDVTGGKSGSIVLDPSSAWSATHTHVWRVDLMTLMSGSANRSIRSLRLLVQVPGNVNQSPAQFRVANALIVGGGSPRPVISAITLGGKTLHRGVVTTGPESIVSTLGTHNVPLATQFSRGRAVTYNPVTHPDVPSPRINFSDSTHDRWLIFSQRFDPGWRLLDAQDHHVGLHVRVYGSVNGWYVPAGLNGQYTIEYTPEKAARVGTWVALCALVAMAGSAICVHRWVR